MKTIGEVFGSAPAAPPPPVKNPFVRDENGKHNLSEINRLMLEKPFEMRRLCIAAGEPVGAWFGDNPR